MEVAVSAPMLRRAGAAAFVLLACGAAAGAGADFELRHPGVGHEIHVSGPALGVGGDGAPVVAVARGDAGGRHVWLARAAAEGEGGAAVRVDPDGLAVDSIHQPPGLAVGADGAVWVSWSSAKPKPEGVLFASDLQLSRSVDGGRSFRAPVRVNGDRPISHSFEGLAPGPDGSAVVAWIDSRDGWEKPATWVARVPADGTPAEEKLADDTCVCCKIAAAGSEGRVALAWRRTFPGDVRDVVVAEAGAAGAAFTPAVRVHRDDWAMEACPHRGPGVGLDARGRVYVAWYTEGADQRARVRFAVSEPGEEEARFGRPIELRSSQEAAPDHVALAVSKDGRALVAWEQFTAVRREIVVRGSRDGGKTFGPPRVISTAVKSYEPAVAVGLDGRFFVAWNEERFPALVTVVREILP